MSTITIIGAGSWGSGLSLLLSDNKHNVKVYDLNKDLINEINTKHTNERYLPGAKLPNNVVGYTDLQEALIDSEIVLIVVPTKVIRQALKEVNKALNHQVIFVNASKGIEPVTYKRVSEIVKEEIDNDKIKGFVALTALVMLRKLLKDN